MVTKTTYLLHRILTGPIRPAFMAMSTLAVASLFSTHMSLAGASDRNDLDAPRSSNVAPGYFKDCDEANTS